jgi:hypothetical protein
MVPPGSSLDDPNKPIERRFNDTPNREVPYRFVTGAIRNISRDTSRAFLGGDGFDLGYVGRKAVHLPIARNELLQLHFLPCSLAPSRPA